MYHVNSWQYILVIAGDVSRQQLAVYHSWLCTSRWLCTTHTAMHIHVPAEQHGCFLTHTHTYKHTHTRHEAISHTSMSAGSLPVHHTRHNVTMQYHNFTHLHVSRQYHPPPCQQAAHLYTTHVTMSQCSIISPRTSM